MFCPFIKNDCVPECAFSNNHSCALLRVLKNIDSNTSSDQTESWSINDKLGDISSKLDRIIKVIEQSVD